MTVGLYDKDIQQEVLARDKTLDTLDKRYELISAYEKSRLTKSQLESDPACIGRIVKMFKRDANCQPRLTWCYNANITLRKGRIGSYNTPS